MCRHLELKETSTSYALACSTLDRLRAAVKALPQTVFLGSSTGLLAKTFAQRPANLHDEGLRYSFNTLWERVFDSQKEATEKTLFILRGKNGLPLVIEFIEFYMDDTQGMADDTWDLMCGRIEHLLKLIMTVHP